MGSSPNEMAQTPFSDDATRKEPTNITDREADRFVFSSLAKVAKASFPASADDSA